MGGMRAAVYHGAMDVRIEERPVPEVRPGHVLMRVTRSGICGTDATEYLHGPGLFPLDRRHPVSGRTARELATALPPGQRIRRAPEPGRDKRV